MDKDFDEVIDNVRQLKTYSGKTTIAPDVLVTITRLTTLRVQGVSGFSPVPGGVNFFFPDKDNEGVRLKVKGDTVTADLYIVIERDLSIKEVSHKVQNQVARAITEMVGMKVGNVNIHVEEINYSEEV